MGSISLQYPTLEVYLRKENTVREEVWNSFFNLLVKDNKERVKNAAVLTVVISKKEFEYVDNRSKYCVKVYINQSEGLKIGLS